MSARQRSLLGRLSALVRGTFGTWIRERESRSPRAVYEQAIAERGRQYRELKRAVAGILYMRNKLEAEIRERRAEIAASHEQVRRAVLRGDDEAALALIERKEGRLADLERAEQELGKVRNEAQEAKVNLTRFREDIRSLEREKLRALATLANAHARRRIRAAFEGLSVESDMQALESVRQHVAELETEERLDGEGADEGLERRLREIRDETRLEGARRELDELKRRLRPSVLPAEVRQPRAAHTG